MSDSVSLCGTDTVIIDDVVQADNADQDFVNIEFPNELAIMKVGKDGNVMAALNAQGSLAEITLRYLRGSPDDKRMNSKVEAFKRSPSTFVLMTAEFVKKIGDGSGTPISDNYVASAGVPSKMVPGKGNADGDTEQAVAVYKIKFGKCARIIT